MSEPTHDEKGTYSIKWVDMLSATVDDLNAEEPQPVSDDQVEAAKRQAEQTHDFRDRFFRTISVALGGTLVASIGIMVAYIVSEWEQLNATVIISFNAAVVVNVLGLAFILASNLFPKPADGKL